MGRRVSVVLITYNSASYLPRCLAGLSQQNDVELELIVVDNHSGDQSVSLVFEAFRDAKVIANPNNRGFAEAANQGIRAATSTLILLLNPDVHLCRGYISGVSAVFDRDSRIGSAAGKLLRGTGDEIAPTTVIDSIGIRMSKSGRHFDDRNGEPDDRALKQPFEVFGVSGAAAMYSRAFLEDAAIDGEFFDERFFAYREDADLAWRGRLLGWKSFCVPTAVAYHVRRVTPESRRDLPAVINMHSVKNRFLLRLNNEGRALALRHLPFELFRDLIVVGGVLTIERSSLPALRWLWQNRAAILARRRRVQSRRRVSDRELLRWFN
jgi:GT2 family glycosyltransferase